MDEYSKGLDVWRLAECFGGSIDPHPVMSIQFGTDGVVKAEPHIAPILVAVGEYTLQGHRSSAIGVHKHPFPGRKSVKSRR